MIYLDHHATTPCDPRVVEAMLPWFTRHFANAHSAEHAPGRAAAAAVEAARAEVAALIGAEPREIVFTSGATESNNLAIKGLARFAGPDPRPGLVTLATEHKCVLESMRDLAAEGFAPRILPVDAAGRPDPAALAAALEGALLLSVMAAHNETGLIQDLPRLAAAAHEAGARFHTDLAQAAGKIPLDLAAFGIDLASLSAHKLYGPKGIGALYVRRRPRTRLAPLFSGGGQERGLRPGTLPGPLIVGFGEACRIARAEMAAEQRRVAGLRDRLWQGLAARIPGIARNGAAPRLAGNLALRIPGIQATALIAACPGLAFSTGSACTSAEIEPSQTLTALGLSAAEAGASLRLCVGRFTSAADIDTAIDTLAREAARLRAAEPCLNGA